MATYEYTGEAELVFPTLGITVKKGDVFEAPADLSAASVSLVKDSKKKPTIEIAAADEAPVDSTETI